MIYYYLSKCKTMGPGTCMRLLRALPGESLFNTTPQSLQKLSFLKYHQIEEILSLKERQKELDKEFQEMKSRGIHFVPFDSLEYPESLKEIKIPPLGLYYRGKLPSKNKLKVAIVGARQATEYGKQTAIDLGYLTTQEGYEVISGLAIGIDGYAQYGACYGKGASFGVLGGGFDYFYPPENLKLSEQVVELGGLISEYPPEMKPKRRYFPVRNRIISGLCDCIIVVEAKYHSGSLITANFAVNQGKEVMMVPGRITDKNSYGCNKFIEEGAKIISSYEDLKIQLKELNNLYYSEK